MTLIGKRLQTSSSWAVRFSSSLVASAPSLTTGVTDISGVTETLTGSPEISIGDPPSGFPAGVPDGTPVTQTFSSLQGGHQDGFLSSPARQRIPNGQSFRVKHVGVGVIGPVGGMGVMDGLTVGVGVPPQELLNKTNF